jgi:hypothetical protein
MTGVGVFEVMEADEEGEEVSFTDGITVPAIPAVPLPLVAAAVTTVLGLTLLLLRVDVWLERRRPLSSILCASVVSRQKKFLSSQRSKE